MSWNNKEETSTYMFIVAFERNHKSECIRLIF